MTVITADKLKHPHMLFQICRMISAKEAAERAGLYLKKHGSRYWANCFLHDDKTPSLAFFEDGGFYCFSCHAGGDAVKLYELLYSLPPTDAAKRLLTDFGLAEPSKDDAKATPIKPRMTAADLQETVETIRERGIDELLVIKRKALKQIDIIEQNSDLSENDRQKVMDLEGIVGLADHQIAKIETLSPGDLVAWVAGGASINAI